MTDSRSKHILCKYKSDGFWVWVKYRAGNLGSCYAGSGMQPKLWRRAGISIGDKWEVDNSGCRTLQNHNVVCQCVWSSFTKLMGQAPLWTIFDSSLSLLSQNFIGNTFTVSWRIYSSLFSLLRPWFKPILPFSHTILTSFWLVYLLLIYLHSDLSSF